MGDRLVVGKRYNIVSRDYSKIEGPVTGTFVGNDKPDFFRFENVTDQNGLNVEGTGLFSKAGHTFTPVSGGRRRKTRKHKRVSRKTRRYRK